MSNQITPEQINDLLTLSAMVLTLVVLRLTGLAVWRKWFANATTTDDGLTQEERDERQVTRRRRR